jgi:hypothetical protein
MNLKLKLIWDKKKKRNKMKRRSKLKKVMNLYRIQEAKKEED